MNGIKLHLAASIFAAILFSNCNGSKPKEYSNKLDGAWTVVEITKVNGDSTQIVNNPQPGIWIFSDDSYSATWSLSSDVRDTYAQPFSPTQDEMIKAYQTIVVNTGTYELTDTTMTTYPVLARVPAFSGGKSVWDFRLESDIIFLTIREEYSKKGEWARWLDDFHYSVKLERIKR